MGARHKTKTGSVCTSLVVVNKGDWTAWNGRQVVKSGGRIFQAHCGYYLLNHFFLAIFKTDLLTEKQQNTVNS